MFVCSECGNESLKWKGQCDICKTWGTLKEFHESKEKKGSEKKELRPLVSLSESQTQEDFFRFSTFSPELNLVLGGGIVPGSIILLSGEPGIGKSTLSLQLAKWCQEEIVYISGEETNSQIAGRAKRLGINGNHIHLLSEQNIESIFASLEKSSAKIAIFDSISVMQSDEINGTAGSVSQVRYLSEKITEFGKNTNTACIIIGHVTKDGSLAGPKTLEHMVDTVLYFEGDRYDNLRILRCLKNRFGSASEVGLYKMTDIGLVDFIESDFAVLSGEKTAIGSALSITLEGTRPLLVETEALTSYTKFGYPKRSSRGIPASKLDLIIAVLGKYTSIKLESYDVYLNISRGLSVEEPALDLALAASICSSKIGKTLPEKSIFLGEISLTGNIKAILHLEKRLKEAQKLGIQKIFCPASEALTEFLPSKSNLEIIPIKHISELITSLS